MQQQFRTDYDPSNYSPKATNNPTVTEFLSNYTPPEKGDDGGNGFALSGLKEVDELHALWDYQLDLDDQEKGTKEDNIHPDHSKIEQIASALESKYPKTYFNKELKKSDPKDWALESFSYRVKVYSLTPDAMPGDEYLNFAKDTSEERITLAGYRLAALLKSALR